MTPQDGKDAEPAQPPHGLLAVLLLSTFIVVFDTAGMVIPLPTILEDLGGTLDMAT